MGCEARRCFASRSGATLKPGTPQPKGVRQSRWSTSRESAHQVYVSFPLTC
jgi:hypothetical protein